MTPVLVVEIVSACVALVVAIALLVRLVGVRAGRARPSTGGARLGRHAVLGGVLVVAALVHGVAATAYASGASALAYGFGWLALVAFAASGAAMMPPMRSRLAKSARRWHVGLFVVGLALVVAHAVAARVL